MAQAQITLGNLYSEGLDVPQNLVEAFVWYSIAAAFRDGIEPKLTTGQRKEGNRRLNDFLAGQRVSPPGSSSAGKDGSPDQ